MTRLLPRRLRALAILSLGTTLLASCVKPPAQAPSTALVVPPPPLTEAEDVDHALAQEIDALLLGVQSTDPIEALAATTRATALAADLDGGIRLLTLMRSPRAGALARERARLPDPEEPVADAWSAAQLVRYVDGLLRWEIYGQVDPAAFAESGCVPPPARESTIATLPPWHRAAMPSTDSARGDGAESNASAAHEGSGDGAYDDETPRSARGRRAPAVEALADNRGDWGRCVIRVVDQRLQEADARLTPTLRAGLGAFYENARSWLDERVLPIDDSELVGATDPRLRGAAAWTGLPHEAQFVSANGVIVAIRSHGVYVTTRPSLHAAQVLRPGDAPPCAWPGTLVYSAESLTRPLPLASISSGLQRLSAAVEGCEASLSSAARDGVRASIDAGSRWFWVQPVLRRLVAQRRAPGLIVYSAQGANTSLLPVELVSDVPGDRCGIEAHLRNDGVVLRGGGAPTTTLLAWAESNAFQKLSAAGKEASERCGTDAIARVYVDDANVDWGLIVRALERLSWPQVCTQSACLRTQLIVGSEN